MDPTLQYALTVTGAGFFAFSAWWMFVFLVRNGIDGTRKLEKFLLSRQKRKWRRIFIGDWR